jgi:hypothetical protein
MAVVAGVVFFAVRAHSTGHLRLAVSGISLAFASSPAFEDAVAWAKQLIDLYAVELWCGDRRVMRLQPAAAITATSRSATLGARAELSPKPGSC